MNITNLIYSIDFVLEAHCWIGTITLSTYYIGQDITKWNIDGPPLNVHKRSHDVILDFLGSRDAQKSKLIRLLKNCMTIILTYYKQL